MKKETTRTISTRISLDEFAKARDGMIAKGVDPARLRTNSTIMRTALLMSCLLNEEPESPATSDSTDTIKQLWKIK